MKINELKVNDLITLPLVVMSATARETRAKKPYLVLELFDGQDKIMGNYWDWAGKNIPAQNTILDVNAQVTEWQGTRQLTVKSITTNTVLLLDEFTPASGYDLYEVYGEAMHLAYTIENSSLKTLVEDLLVTLKELWLTAPGAKTIHHAYVGGTLIHSVSVARIAKAIAGVTIGANVDLCTAGGLLHDIGKLYGYSMNGLVADLTDEGKLLDHIFMGAEFVGNFAEGMINENKLPDTLDDLMEILRHIILSHHGKLEHGSPVPPCSIEAHIVHHADVLDAAAEIIRDSSNKAGETKFTDRLYILENRPHLTTWYVDEVMK